MKAKNFLPAIFLLVALFLFGCNNESTILSPNEQSTLQKLIDNSLIQVEVGFDLSQEEIDGLIHMRLEEKLTRDVYTTLEIPGAIKSS